MKFLVVLANLASILPYALAAPKPPTPTPTPLPHETPLIGPLGVQIHSSCNATERHQLLHALAETEQLALVARDHVLNNGPSDKLFKKYFGKGPTAEVIGWFQKLLTGDKSGVLLRCDDIDSNCHQDGWAGHWRGENATEETVICELSYQIRRPLEQMCALGYEVATHKTNVFFASDLVHRFFHVPKVSELVIDHFTDSYEECLEFAKANSTFAVRNTNSLQFFALEAYAYDVAIPGVGCPGKVKTSTKEPETTAPTTTQTSGPTTTEAPKVCHTHADGVEHCE
ncbi:putative peptidase family-domain-containing protein [Kalaharituber pfeilii]|nr:putative peptidase family-domain-containing protein [Kalaharituber pfeilii]